jgi:hypothetical protein
VRWFTIERMAYYTSSLRRRIIGSKLLNRDPPAVAAAGLSKIPIYSLGDGLADDLTRQMIPDKAVEVGTERVIIHRSLYRPVKAFVIWVFDSVGGLIVIAVVVMAITIGISIAFKIMGISMKSIWNSIWSSN